MQIYYGYSTVDGRKKYLGKIKALNAKKALKIAHKKWGDLQLDVIRKRYVADRLTGAMRGPTWRPHKEKKEKRHG